MTCNHKVKWTVKPPEDCRFRLSVSHYKDRIVAPAEYAGATVVTPSDETQILPTKDKLVRDDITVMPAPEPDLRPLSVSENGTYQPDGFDGYSRVEVSVEGQWIDYDDVPVTLPEEYQRVEYIESSGTQFIELPIGFYPTDKVWMKGSVNISVQPNSYMVAPKTWNNSNNRFGLCGWSEIKTNYFPRSLSASFGSMETSRTQFSAPYENDGNIHSYLYKDRTFVLVDMGMTCVVSHITFGSETANLKLFYGYNSNTAGKICYYIHEKADGRKLALYACYRKSDGVIGMYDVENDVFYTNDGTGDFTKGQDI